MKKEEKLRSNLFHKIFLIILKYIPHLNALMYIIYTILSINGIDNNIFGCIFHMSVMSWIFLFISSLIFKYCWVHRLPLYYILLNESITCIDYYIGIPLKDFHIITIHVLLIAFVIFGYSYYHLIKLKRYARQKKIRNT